ncbi:serine hydrolase domain-containing protein [Sorangium sp. So ce1024]|uniref:serine hydrolase domain-containing protein n=1 Tax=unclassified Sorangium TaxID=2621164 RepID=UPI003F079F50
MSHNSSRVASRTDETSPLVSEMDRIAAQALQQGPVAGMAIGVARGRDIITRGYGFADIENGVRVTDQTVFRIASITKQFTAAAVIQLAQRQKLRLEDDITSFVPQYTDRSHKVTVRHLLCHTSGIKDYTKLGAAWDKVVTRDLSHEELLALFMDAPRQFAPGEQYAYSNSGYYLLGMIIEAVSGQTYADYLRTHIFSPLGLNSTSYCGEDSLNKHRARGYRVVDGKLSNASPMSMSQPFAAGALCSTVTDLLAWQRALNEHRVVAKEWYDLMKSPCLLNDGSKTSYGQGISISDTQGHVKFGHGGGINGFSAQLNYYPDSDVTIVVLSNTEGIEVPRVEQRVARRALGLPDEQQLDLPLSPGERATFTGTYRTAEGLVVEIIETEGKLWVKGPKRSVELAYQGNNTFVAPGLPLSFKFAVRGDKAEFMDMDQAGMKYRATRRDP